MATLICPLGHDDPGDGAMCAHCGGYLRKAPPQETGTSAGRPAASPAPETCAEPGCGLELDESGCPLHGATVPLPPRQDGGTGAPRAGTAHGSGAPGLAVVFPWDSYPLGVEPLVVGRSVGAAGELAERMLEHGRWTGRDYGNVSRSHAVVWSDAEGTWIRHLSTTNDTLVNGHALPHDEPRRLRAGDVLTFAKGLRAHVSAQTG
jgi:hypothetical protein